MERPICSSCSEPLSSKFKYLPICKACSSSLVDHIFSNSRHSALSKILPLSSETENPHNLAIKRVLQYSSLDRRDYIDEKSRNDMFIEEFYNLSLYGQESELTSFYVLETGNNLLIQISYKNIKPSYYEKIDLNNYQSQHLRYVSTSEGYIMVCANSNSDNKSIFYLYHKSYCYNLLCYGISPFKGNPSLSLAGNTIYTFLEGDSSYKFNYETRVWEPLLVKTGYLKNLYTTRVGSKILIAASNRRSLFIYSMLGDYLSEFNEIFSTEESKAVLFNGNKVYYIEGEFISTTDLRFLGYQNKIQVKIDINLIISPPVLYNNNFYIQSSAFIYKFSPDTLRIEKFGISESISGINYRQNFT